MEVKNLILKQFLKIQCCQCKNVLIKIRKKNFKLFSFQLQHRFLGNKFFEIPFNFMKYFFGYFDKEFEQVDYYFLVKLKTYIAQTHIWIYVVQNVFFISYTTTVGKQFNEHFLHEDFFHCHLFILIFYIPPSCKQVYQQTHLKIINHDYILNHKGK